MPDYTPGYYRAGALHMERGDYPQALALLKRATELEPGYSEAYFEIVRGASNVGDMQTAREAFDTLRWLDEDLAAELLTLYPQLLAL